MPVELPPHPRRIWLVLLLILGLSLLAAWLALTPPGLLGKADALGYAVCHRILERSFHLSERALPLCARCTGLYLGALLGFICFSRLNRRSGLPTRRVWAILAPLALAFIVDSLNSAAHLLPGAPGWYEPNNPLRLFTGLAMGLVVASLLLPVFRDTFFNLSDPAPILSKPRELLPALGLAALTGLAFLSGNPLLLYPLGLLSAASLWMVVALLHSTLWVYLFHWENRFTSLSSAWLPLLLGIISSLAQFALLDAARYALTQSWSGLVL